MLRYRVPLISAGVYFQVAVEENEEKERRGGGKKKIKKICAWHQIKARSEDEQHIKLRRRAVTSGKLQTVTCVREIFKVSSHTHTQKKIYAEDIKGSRLHTVCSALHCNELFFSRAVKLIHWICCGLGFYMKAALPRVTNAHCWIVAVHLRTHTHGLYLVKNGCVCAT